VKQFLAIYIGHLDAAKTAPDSAIVEKGMRAWGEWMQRNAGRIVNAGGPLWRTMVVSSNGVQDTRNPIAGYIVVQANSLSEAAKLFESHPHFAIFPGKEVEVMECLPMPGS